MEKSNKKSFSVEPIAADSPYVDFVSKMLADRDTAAILHCGEIPSGEMEEVFRDSETDSDEENFIIKIDDSPIAWIKINGLDGEDAWLSMLVVDRKFRNRGAGIYGVKFAEIFAVARGKNYLKIHTTDDNEAAKTLYGKCGFRLNAERKSSVYEDGTEQTVLTFEKSL